MALAERIKAHIVDQYLAGDGAGLEVDTPLLELNVIDSAGIFDLMRFLSEETAVRIPLSEVTPDNFQSIAAMVQLVERLPRGA